MLRKPNRKEVGSAGEKLAAGFLRRQGYRILARNYRTPYGEIDLVAYQNKETVFIEVKTRQQKVFGTPAEALTRSKVLHWERAASFYLQKIRGFSQPFRFDFVGIDLTEKTPEISLIKNVL